MIRLLSRKRPGPIGVDIGTRSIKLLQLASDGRRVVDVVRRDLPGQEDRQLDDDERAERVVETLRLAQEGRGFRGRDAIVCLGANDLVLQNLRVPHGSEEAIRRAAEQEAVERLPYPVTEAELRLVPVGEVCQQDAVVHEVLLFACHQDQVRQRLELVERAGLRPVAVDIEPAALLRNFRAQSRREEDREQRAMYVHVGHAGTAVFIADGEDPLLVKYINVGGKDMDRAVADRLEVGRGEATALRRHHGDRPAEQQDPEIAGSIAAAVRPVVEQLVSELLTCVRYHSVTFRGKPLARTVLGGGEATALFADTLTVRLNVECELADPLRSFETTVPKGRVGQWDVAAGLALKLAN